MCLFKHMHMKGAYVTVNLGNEIAFHFRNANSIDSSVEWNSSNAIKSSYQ